MNMNVTVEGMINALKHAGHSVFEDDSKPYNLNIVGVRADKPVVDKFNCLLVVLWKYEGRWNLIQMQATTYPGLQYLKKPINPKGCAILKEGRYKASHKLDLHNSQYLALCQRGEVEVYRDNDKDVEYTKVDGVTEKGYFGINIHRASMNKELENVGPYSAGCQVIQDPIEFDIFVEICKKAKMNWGDFFTYTLIKQSDYVEGNKGKSKNA